jgi:hypothetical protein
MFRKRTGATIHRFPAHFKKHLGGCYVERADSVAETAQTALKGHDLFISCSRIIPVGYFFRRTIFFEEAALLPA